VINIVIFIVIIIFAPYYRPGTRISKDDLDGGVSSRLGDRGK
jgi:hypothetical protein